MLSGFQDSVTKAYINKIPYFLWNLLKLFHCFAKHLGIINEDRPQMTEKKQWLYIQVNISPKYLSFPGYKQKTT